MTYTYGLVLDKPYFRTMIARYYQQRPLLLRPAWQFALAGAVLIVALPFVPFEGDRVGFFLGMAFLYGLFAVAGLAVIRVFVFQKFKYTSYFGKDSSCALRDEGLRVSGPSREHLTEWSNFRSAVRYPDGIMLLRRGVIWWLPDAALQGASPEDVSRFLGTKTAVRNVA
jgi:hypothetical protein